MTRQFHARVRRRPSSTDTRARGEHVTSFRCYRLVPLVDADEPFEIVELCDPRNAMRVLVYER